MTLYMPSQPTNSESQSIAANYAELVTLEQCWETTCDLEEFESANGSLSVIAGLAAKEDE
jgi:hypothetical protein